MRNNVENVNVLSPPLIHVHIYKLYSVSVDYQLCSRFKIAASAADCRIRVRNMICCYNTIKYTGLLSNLLYMVRWRVSIRLAYMINSILSLAATGHRRVGRSWPGPANGTAKHAGAYILCGESRAGRHHLHHSHIRLLWPGLRSAKREFNCESMHS